MNQQSLEEQHPPPNPEPLERAGLKWERAIRAAVTALGYTCERVEIEVTLRRINDTGSIGTQHLFKHRWWS